MEKLRYTITPEGTLGEPWFPPEKEEKKASGIPGSALADLLSEGLNRALQPSLDEETLHTYFHA